MNGTWISAPNVFDGFTLHRDHAIHVQDGRVTDLRPTKDLTEGLIGRHLDGLLTPGFFDIQVNGGGGIMLNSTPTVAGIQTILDAHRTFGTVAMLPTVITDAPEVLENAADACLSARDLPGMAGLHIEGPHISSVRRGTHATRHIRPLDESTRNIIAALRKADLPVLITVAPETVSPPEISALADMGAVVSLGHSNANAELARAAISAGATCATHLFNAMPPLVNREPGVAGAAIASDAWCSIIADGIHVDPIMVALAVRARPVADRMIAVSDAMSTVGGPDSFDLYGQTITLSDGRLVNSEGSLAGAHLTMHTSLQNLVSYGIDLETALRMCCGNPAELMGLGAHLGLLDRPCADILWLDADLNLKSTGIDLPIPA